MEKLTVGSCFSGIGGLELGLEWTGGFETKWQIEIDPYATKVLETHWPSVKRYSDITTVGGGNLEPVDVICGGFPCQDVSFAGKRAGLEGKRSTLWGEMFRLVCEVKPKWLLAENVPGLLSSDDGRFFGNILRDLASIGFDAEWGVLSAAGVGAPHIRRRVFILAHPNSDRRTEGNWGDIGIDQTGENTHQKRPADSGDFGRSSQSMADTSCANEGIEQRRTNQGIEGKILSRRGSNGSRGNVASWSTEPNVGRVAHGIPSRVDRLRCLGNAVVPQVAQKVGEMILKADRRMK